MKRESPNTVEEFLTVEHVHSKTSYDLQGYSVQLRLTAKSDEGELKTFYFKGNSPVVKGNRINVTYPKTLSPGMDGDREANVLAISMLANGGDVLRTDYSPDAHLFFHVGSHPHFL